MTNIHQLTFKLAFRRNRSTGLGNNIVGFINGRQILDLVGDFADSRIP